MLLLLSKRQKLLDTMHAFSHHMQCICSIASRRNCNDRCLKARCTLDFP